MWPTLWSQIRCGGRSSSGPRIPLTGEGGVKFLEPDDHLVGRLLAVLGGAAF